jgi:hypothetical protein
MLARQFAAICQQGRDMISGYEAASKLPGGVPQLARLFGISDKAIYKWDVIPLNRVKQLSEITGISVFELRPDVFSQINPRGMLDDEIVEALDRAALACKDPYKGMTESRIDMLIHCAEECVAMLRRK